MARHTLAGLGLLDDALALDLRKPQDYLHRVWSTAFRAADLADAAYPDEDKHDDQHATTDDEKARAWPSLHSRTSHGRRKAEASLQRIHEAITRLKREKAQVSIAAVARRAHVSRTFLFLYNNPIARAAVAAAMTDAGERRSQTLVAADDEPEATWRERALNAEDALKATHTEILTQRTRIGDLLGQIRDVQAEWAEEAIQRITTENTTLKQRVRQLTADNRTLDERLKAVRSNLRFQGRRVADLEVRLSECVGSISPTDTPRSAVPRRGI